VVSEDRVVYAILGAARAVHSALGPGFIERIYVRALLLELKGQGYQVEHERTIKIRYGEYFVGKHRLDLLVNGCAIVELKASRCIIPVHFAQMQSYLHASDYPLGLILNFGTTELQWEVIRKSDLIVGPQSANKS
jgi:GxxExxY protein